MKQIKNTSTPPNAKARIAIADDETAQMKALCATLRDEGFETVGFSNGSDALAALRETEFDLLLADLMMPGMDGIELLRRALEIRPNLVGIIMTGEGAISTAVSAMQSGALDYILKPFKLSVILPVIHRGLTVRQLRIQKLELEQRLRERTAEVEAANAKLEGANEELKAYSYSIAHDLRAPLRAMDGFARILQRKFGPQITPEAHQHIERICENAARMAKLVDGLLDFSSLNWVPVTTTTVEPKKIVQDILDEAGADLSKRSVDLQIEKLPPCKGDPTLLRQVFANLISNALKYSRNRDPAVIRVGWRQENGEGVYFVRDNGAGFNMEYSGKLFRVFQRLHSEEEFEGTGVGLAIVHRIIQRHGGRIWAEGEVDRGATFYFTLDGHRPE